jgi:hypothetical protein
VRFRYQVREETQRASGAPRFVYVCSQTCQQVSLGAAPDGRTATGSSAGTSAGAAIGAASSEKGCVCDVCARPFALEYPFQVQASDRGARYFCSMPCKSAAAAGAFAVGSAGAQKSRGPRRIAVFNHKGGTGKTTTSVNLAAGLAEAGYNVLLVDADGQGNVGASLGIRGEKTLYHVLVHGAPAGRRGHPGAQGARRDHVERDPGRRGAAPGAAQRA